MVHVPVATAGLGEPPLASASAIVRCAFVPTPDCLVHALTVARARWRRTRRRPVDVLSARAAWCRLTLPRTVKQRAGAVSRKVVPVARGAAAAVTVCAVAWPVGLRRAAAFSQASDLHAVVRLLSVAEALRSGVVRAALRRIVLRRRRARIVKGDLVQAGPRSGRIARVHRIAVLVGAPVAVHLDGPLEHLAR
eukprot:COSAG03_NODE_668_length_6372_cov_3.782879_5_plen_193_part_00